MMMLMTPMASTKSVLREARIRTGVLDNCEAMLDPAMATRQRRGGSNSGRGRKTGGQVPSPVR
jgi:hypothetical protein